jgi:hypothetical protein
MLAGAAFPFMIMVIFSSTIILFASYDDLTVKLIATIGGELLILAAVYIFGKNNGAAAYRKYVLGVRKRALNSTDKKAIYKTGEYSLWKGIAIPLITVIPFVIFQIINIAAPNNFTYIMLLYMCGWAYYPFTFFDIAEAFNFILIILPVGAHLIGYVIGKIKEEKIQQQIAMESENVNKKKRKK